MTMNMRFLSLAAAIWIGAASTVHAAVVFEADFQGAETTNLLPVATADREIILNSGTASGSWDDNDKVPNNLYEIAEDELGNKVFVYSAANQNIAIADLDFDSIIDIPGNEILTASWDWMRTDKMGGGNGTVFFEVLNSNDTAEISVRWLDGSSSAHGPLTLNIDSVNYSLGNFSNELEGVSATVLSTNNWDPLSMELTISGSSVEISADGVVLANLPASISSVLSGIRIRSTSNRSYSHAGAWIDNILVESATASSASLVLNPSSQLNIALDAPNSTAVEAIDVSFVYGPESNNVDITSVSFSALSHGADSFTCTNGFPLSLVSPSPAGEALGIQFDNGVAGLSHGASASGTIEVNWTEIGSGTTNTTELPVVATYNDTPALFSFGQTAMSLVVAAPATASTGTVSVSYTESTALKTNVVITAIDFTNTTASVFSGASTNLPLTIAYPSPSNDTISIAFDASGMSSGDTATGNVVVTWNELGDATEHVSILPLSGAYHVLPSASGTYSIKGTVFPTNNVVLASKTPLTNKGTSVSRRGPYDTGGYSKIGQEIKASALTPGNAEFDSIYLKMKQGAGFANASGANQMQMWFGKIDETTGETNETLAVETFDCSGASFSKNRYYEFAFSAPVDFEPTNLASNEAYAIQMWFTTDDANNLMQFWRGTTNYIAGGFHEESDAASADATFPVMLDGREDSSDLHFALVNSAGISIPDIGHIVVEIDGSNIIMSWLGVSGTDYLQLKTEDLVLGPWTTNVVPGVDGQMSVTNDTSDPKAFFRVIVE